MGGIVLSGFLALFIVVGILSFHVFTAMALSEKMESVVGNTHNLTGIAKSQGELATLGGESHKLEEALLCDISGH